MKIMKKSLNIILSVALLLVTFATPVYNVHAQTLGDLKAELQAKEDAYNKKKEEKQLTEDEKKKVQKNIDANEQKIIDLKNDNIKLDNEISELNKSMSSKYDEIKKIANYNQVSNGESSTLEYIFGAKTFTDFIYRASIAEQLTKYNKELITSYEEDIKQSKNKQEANQKNRDQIASIQVTLNADKAKLGQQIEDLNDEMMSAAEEAKSIKDNILELQRTYKCGDDENIESCKAKARKNLAGTIPASTGDFKRPIINAIVTANYGYYDPYHTRKPTWHAAMDLAGNPGSKIYAAAAGKVVEVKHQSCGNHIVYIVHNIKGHYYTTGYWHMRTSYVSEGDIVSANTVIGIQGGASWEDSCSTGQHLDFVMTNGAYKTDYGLDDGKTPRSVSYNPRLSIDFPPLISNGWEGLGTSAEWTTR